MVKVPKGVGWFAAAISWIATVFPGTWVALVATLAASAATFWLASLKWLESPELHTIAFVFLAWLWTVIGLVTIADRRKPVETYPKKDFRYGLTFEGLFANFDPNHEDASLQIGVNLRNYSPGALRYEVEEFSVKIDSRSIDSGPIAPIFMSRGAGRSTHNLPFKFSHVKEFLGTRPEGLATFSIAYGDVDGPPSRRLKMSLKTYFSFPTETLLKGAVPGMPTLGFNATILKESDEPISRPN